MNDGLELFCLAIDFDILVSHLQELCVLGKCLVRAIRLECCIRLVFERGKRFALAQKLLRLLHVRVQTKCHLRLLQCFLHVIVRKQDARAQHNCTCVGWIRAIYVHRERLCLT